VVARVFALVADKAYDSQALRDILRWLGIDPHIPRRRQSSRGLGKTRWPVERTIAWLHQFRRLRTRWDRRVDFHQSFLTLAASIICYRLLKRSTFCP
jgi:transposase